MKRFFIAAGLAALVAVPVAGPVLAQTVIVTPAAEPPPPPPPPTVIYTDPAPPPQPVTECEKSTTTSDKLIGSKTETSTRCTTTTPAPY